jgi:site-specific recombinase XerD
MADGGADLRIVRHSLRHASLTSTNRYLHTPGEERHPETEEKHRIDW